MIMPHSYMSERCESEVEFTPSITGMLRLAPFVIISRSGIVLGSLEQRLTCTADDAVHDGAQLRPWT